METYLAVISIGLLYIGLLSPVLCAWYLAVVKGRGVKWRWLFPFVAPVVAYSITGLTILIFFTPFYLIALYIVPSLVESGYKPPFWVPMLEWVLMYDGYIVAIALVGMSAWLARYLWPRWQSRFGVNT